MLVTSSRRRSLSTIRFCKEVTSVLPLSIYVPRGSKQMRTLITRAYEMGMERICIVETKDKTPHRISFIEVDDRWRWIGHIDIAVSLSGTIASPIDEEIELGIVGRGPHLADLAYFFNAVPGEGDLCICVKGDTITFYRNDSNITPVGPEITILDLHRYGTNEQEHQTEDIHPAQRDRV